MNSLHKQYILTGAPGTGKSSLITSLKNHIPCMEEVSRKVIIAEQEKQGNGTPWGNISRFVNLVYQETLNELAHNDALICDRSLLDLQAYLRVEDKPIPIYLKNFEYSKIYHKKVFLTPTWQAIYSEDAQRLQSFTYALEFEKALIASYCENGFEIIILPKTSIINRTSIILENLRQL